MGFLKLGEVVLLFDQRSKKYLVRVDPAKEFHTDFGKIRLSELLKKDYGEEIQSHLGRTFKIIKPRISDLISKIERPGTIVLSKDVGQIVAGTGVGPGDFILDAGTGSGALAIYLGYLVQPNGKVITYEIKSEFIEIAKRNIELVGLNHIITVKNKDVTQGFEENEVDLITLDLSSPEKVIEHAKSALKAGGYVVIYSPFIEQVQKVNEALHRYSLQEIKTIECLTREIEVTKRGTRPKTRMVGHTGYLTFARKI
ncbi:MAG: tRNA (adenine-N1)-methyltransferase [Euryarchaeota archaeon]|nr:tRNA (adenine-N1)-methyltransferase [Euryarchaeota archaeon]